MTSKEQLPKGFVGVYEFSRQTGLDIAYVYRLIYGGKLQGAKKLGRKWAIPQGEMKSRMPQQTVGA